MFTNDLTLNAHNGLTAGTNSDKTFVLRNLDGGNSDRIEPSSTPSTPFTLAIKHQTAGKGGTSAKRHLIRGDKTFAPTTTAPAQTLSAQIVLHVPDNTVTVQDVIDVLGIVIDVCKQTSAVSKLMNGES